MLTQQTLVKSYNPHAYHSFFLGADIGGTNSRLVLAGRAESNVREGQRESLEMLALLTCKTAGVRDFYEPLREAMDLAETKFSARLKAIAIAAAGPVQMHRWCRLTNFDLEIDAEKLAAGLNVPCFIVNDFEALGYSINFLEAGMPGSLLALERGRRTEGLPGARALLGIGTGLGKSILVPSAELGFFTTLPSEGGHADLPVGEPLEWEMASHLKEVTGFPVCYEDILSGRGLANLYEYLKSRGLHPPSPATPLIDRADDRAAAIARHYLQDETAGHAVQMVVNIFARAARNFALDVLARGGVYLGGGIVAHNVVWLTDGRFVREFEEHRQYRPLLEQIPINVITTHEAGAYGAAFVASRGEELWSRIM